MARRNQSLVLEVSARIDQFEASMKGVKSLLRQGLDDAKSYEQQVKDSLASLGGGSAEASARQIEKSWDKTFKSIVTNAKLVTAETSKATALQLLDVGAADEQVSMLQRNAAAFRQIGAAAEQKAKAEGGAAVKSRELSAAMFAAAETADAEAVALQLTANEVRELSAAIGTSDATVKRSTVSAGQKKVALQQLGYQVNDVAAQFAGGTPVLQIFGQQMGQVTQAVGMMSNSSKGFIGFLSGPWGIGLTAATVILAPLVAKLFEGAEASDEAREAAGRHTDALDFQRSSTAELTAAIEKQLVAARKAVSLAYEQAEAAREAAKQNLNAAIAKREETRATIEGLRVAQRVNAGQGTGGVAGAAAGIQAAGYVSDLADQDVNISRLEEVVRLRDIPIVRREIAAATDDVAKAALTAERAEAALDKRYREGKISLQAYRAELTKVTETKDQETEAARKAEREARKTAKPPSVGSQVDTARGNDLFAAAERYRGLSEHTDRASLPTMLGLKGAPIDPEKTAWCAAFVNAVLAGQGLGGTGSLAARSFLDYGKGTAKPEKGDIVVSRRGSNPAQGHVGFYQGRDAKGNILVLGGNTGDKVGTQTVKASDVLGFRRATGSTSDADSAAKAQARLALDALRDARAFEDAVTGANLQILRAKTGSADSEDQRLQLQLDLIAGERDARERAIDRRVTDGDITAAQAEQLKALERVVDAIDEEGSRREASARVLAQQEALQRQELDGQVALLRLQSQFATTLKDRKAIAQKLLDADYRQRRDDALKLVYSNDPADQRRGEAELGQIEAERPFRQDDLDRELADPVEQYIERLRAATGDMDTAFDDVRARGMQNLEDGLIGIITGTESVADAFGRMADQIIADLVRIMVQKLILNAVSGGTFGGLFADGGKIEGRARGGRLDGFAGGGRIRGPGSGTSDSILALVDGGKPILVSNGEAIMTERAVDQYWPILDAMNKGAFPAFAEGGLVTPRVPNLPRLPHPAMLARPQSSGDRLQVDVRAKVEAGEGFNVKMEEVAARTIGAAADPIMSGAEARTRRGLARPRLPGGVGWR